MTVERRSVFAVTALSIAVVAFSIDGIANGLTALGAIGIACLVLAVVAQLVVLARAKRQA